MHAEAPSQSTLPPFSSTLTPGLDELLVQLPRNYLKAMAIAAKDCIEVLVCLRNLAQA